MSSFRHFLENWNAANPGHPIRPLAFSKLCDDIERMDGYDKIRLMDLEDHIEGRISNAVWEVEAGEDM